MRKDEKMSAAEKKALGLVAARELFRSGVRKATLRNLEAKGLVTIETREHRTDYRPRGFCGSWAQARTRITIEWDVRLTEAGKAALA